MRVIAGEFRSRILETLNGNEITRPTLDKTKEAFFSSIGGYLLEDTYFLDLFAGSGAIGIEARSRGCKNVILNDKNRMAYNIINKNVTKLAADGIVVYNLDCFVLLEKLQDMKFDYIYLDPPYELKIINKILDYIDERQLLNINGIIIVESNTKDIFNNIYLNFEIYKEKKYRLTKLTYYRRKK